MNTPALTFALRSLQGVVYIQTHDILAWLDSIQTLVRTYRRETPNLFFLRPGAEFTPKGWRPASPEPPRDLPPGLQPTQTFDVEFTDEQVLNGLKSIRNYASGDTTPYFVIPNVVLTPEMVAEFRLLRLQQEMDDKIVKGVVVLSHAPPPADLRPFCQYIVDPGPTEEEIKKFLATRLPRLRCENVPVEPLAKIAEGYSFFQINEAVTRTVILTRKLDAETRMAEFPEAFEKTLADTPKAYGVGPSF